MHVHMHAYIHVCVIPSEISNTFKCSNSILPDSFILTKYSDTLLLKRSLTSVFCCLRKKER